MLFVFLSGCAFRQPSAVCPRLASVARLIWEIPRRSGIGQIPPELSGILDGFWYGPYIWSPYGHICFVPNIPLGELANAKEENWLVWPVKKHGNGRICLATLVQWSLALALKFVKSLLCKLMAPHHVLLGQRKQNFGALRSDMMWPGGPIDSWKTSTEKTSRLLFLSHTSD